MERKHQKILDILSKIAIDVEPVSNAKLASAIVYKNDIISIGINRKKSHPFHAKYGKNEDCIYLHAETDAIKNALRRIPQEELAKTTMYICRVKRPDHVSQSYVWGLSKPCEGCARAISTFGIKKVIFTCDDGSYKYL